MASASNLQSSFHGGEWSPFTQGRMDRPDYRSGMNVCLNTIPLEEAAATRRPGFRRVSYTRGAALAALREFHFANAEPYVLELTAGHLRVLAGAPRALNNSALVTENSVKRVLSFSSATPASVGTNVAHGWATGDQVLFSVGSDIVAPAMGHLLGRQFTITSTGTTTFTLADAVTGAALDGSLIGALPSSGLFVGRIYDAATPYTADELSSIRTVQDRHTLALFQENHAPRLLIASTEPSTCENATLAISTGALQDGPYFDPETDGSTVTPSALTGAVTVTASIAKFASTDVGRVIRILSEPAAWSIATAYVAGNAVKRDDLYYRARSATTGSDPLTNPAVWMIDPTAAQWGWGFITAFSSATVVTVTLHTDLLYTTAAHTYRLGLYSDTTGWPTGGAFHGGRLYIWGNVIQNRVDGSKSNGGFADGQVGLFSPTNPDGSVSDDCAVAAVFQSKDVNPINWAVSDDQGLIFGTQSAEWIIRAGATDDAITPTSIRAKPVSRYGSSTVEPVRVGDALLFVNRFNRKIMEFMASATSSSPRYSASNLTLKAKHLSAAGIAKLAYQAELVPVVWALTATGGLIGMTYKKDGQYNGIPEDIQAWHQHTHGAGRTFVDLVGGPTGQGLDTLYAVTHGTDGYQIEQLTLIFGQNAEATTGNFLDSSVVPTAAELYGAGPDGVRYYGLDHLEGQSVTVWASGLDCGEFVVTGGVVQVPFGSASGEFTSALLTTLTAQNSTFLGLAVNVAGTSTPVTPTVLLTGFRQLQPGSETITAPGEQILIRGAEGYAVSSGHDTTLSGYRVYSLATGFVVRSATVGQLQANGFPATSGGLPVNVGALAVAESGAIYTSGGSSNTEAIYKINADFTGGGQWGTPSGGTGGGGGMLAPAELVALTVGGVDFFAGVGFAFSPAVLVVGNGTTMNVLDRWSVAGSSNTKHGHVAVQSAQASDCVTTGRVFALVADDTTTTTELDVLYADITVSSTGTVQVATGALVTALNPASVDAAWTGFGSGGEASGSFNVDQTDGHLLAVLYGNTAPLRKVVKINSQTGAVMWATTVTSEQEPPLHGDVRAAITDGTFIWKSTTAFTTDSYHVYQLNTLTGAITTLGTVIGLSGATVWDGIGAYLVGSGSFTKATAGFPVATPNATFSSRFYVFTGTPGSTTGTTFNGPCAIGATYTSQGQQLRSILDSGAVNGPALGKTRRAHEFALLLQRAGPMEIGTSFSALRPVVFAEPNGTAYAFGRLYSGIVQDTIEDDYGFDSRVCWEITRPVPATVLAIEVFLQTQDRS